MIRRAAQRTIRMLESSVEPSAQASSPWQSYAKVRVAAVMDGFSEACLAPEVALFPLHSAMFKLQLDLVQPHVLLVESAWSGRYGSWKRKIASYEGHHDDALAELVRECRRRDIPTVFWNKEDPVHFDRFAEAAALFDYVVTSDEACAAAYARELALSERHVRPMTFAAQPQVHFPSDARRAPTVCFAGSYGEAEFPERRQRIELLLDACKSEELIIYDRRFGQKGQQFPQRFLAQVRKPMPYDAMNEEYRRHRAFLNVNTVEGSLTMFSRRVFELLACGTAVVSTPSRGLEALFADCLWVAHDAQEARAALGVIRECREQVQERTLRGLYRVLGAHTYRHRLSDLFTWLGIASACTAPAVALLAWIRDEADITRLVDTLARQTRKPERVCVLASASTLASQASKLLNARFPGLLGKAGAPSEHTEASPGALARLARELTCPYTICLSAGRTWAATTFEHLFLTTLYESRARIGFASSQNGQFQRATEIDHGATIVPTGLLSEPEQAAWLMGDNGPARGFAIEHVASAALS
jgi:spore maturation protein CgeB